MKKNVAMGNFIIWLVKFGKIYYIRLLSEGKKSVWFVLFLNDIINPYNFKKRQFFSQNKE